MIDINSNINWLEQQAKLIPNSIAIADDSGGLTFNRMHKIVQSIIRKIKYSGIKEGDNVGLLFSNSADFILTVNALWKVGAIPVPLSMRLSSSELEVQIEFASIKYLIIEDSLYNNFLSLNVSKVFLYSEFTGSSNSKFESAYQFDSSNTALILFTSGSTSEPKAVKLTFSNLYYSAEGIVGELNINSSDSFLASLPFYHIGGFSIITRALIIGSTIILPNSLSTDDLYSAIQRYSPTTISIVPTTLKRFLDLNYSPNNELRFVFLGGAPIDSSIIVSALSKNWNLQIVYGSTETSSMVALLKTKEIIDRLDCAGKPIGKNKILIKDSNDAPLPPGKEGNIVVQSKSVMSGYLKSSLMNILNSQYLTDDIGYLDEDGYLYITGRRDDVIISGGENINCREVDKYISAHPNIIDSYCFGLEDNEWGQVLCAAIVVADKNSISENSLKEFMKKNLASFKIPKKFFCVAEIPKSDLGKVNKIKLLELINLN